MTYTSDFLWCFSTVTKTALQSGSPDYRIMSFTWQADQTSPILGWHDPQREGTERPRRQRYSAMLNQAQRADGFYIMTLCFAVFTPLQLGYIDTQQFSSGAVESAPATIQVYDDEVRGFSAFTVTANRPVPGQDFEYRDGFYVNVKYRMTAGTKL